MSLNPNARQFCSMSPSTSPTPMEKKVDTTRVRLDYAFPYTLQPVHQTKNVTLRQGTVSPFQKPSEVIRNTHFRPISS
jgi:hypothetical protein